MVIGFIFLDFSYFWYEISRPFVGHTTVYIFSNQAQKVIAPNQLTIQDLNIKAPIVYIDKSNPQADESALQQGVVHYPGTALPGELGNCYIFGHSSDYIWRTGKYKTIFAPLPSIAVGDAITVSNPAGEVFTYTVTKTFVTGPSDTSVLDQQGNTKKLLTLQTSYPLGTALKRFIVQAELKN